MFQSIIEFAGDFFVEKNHQLAGRSPIFCSAETENVNASLPCDRFRRTTQECNRVGKTRPVHVEKHFTRVRELGDSGDLIASVNGSKLRGLRDADHTRLMRMQFVLARDHGFCLSDVDLSVRAADQKTVEVMLENGSDGQRPQPAAYAGSQLAAGMTPPELAYAGLPMPAPDLGAPREMAAEDTEIAAAIEANADWMTEVLARLVDKDTTLGNEEAGQAVIREALLELGLAPVDVPMDPEALHAHPAASPFDWDVADKKNNISSMARFTGFPSAISTMLIASGDIGQKGILAPEDAFVGPAYTKMIAGLKKRNIDILEETQVIG